jgi:hypothetical protein
MPNLNPVPDSPEHLALEEETDTLLCFDVVDMKYPLQPALEKAIKKEGKLLYEKV